MQENILNHLRVKAFLCLVWTWEQKKKNRQIWLQKLKIVWPKMPSIKLKKKKKANLFNTFGVIYSSMGQTL